MGRGAADAARPGTRPGDAVADGGANPMEIPMGDPDLYKLSMVHDGKIWIFMENDGRVDGKAMEDPDFYGKSSINGPLSMMGKRMERDGTAGC